MAAICKRCMLLEQDESKLLGTLGQYIDSIADEDKVSQEIYEKRLSVCDGCESLRGGLCGFCGCFVVVRAIKKKMYCPHPKGERWQ